MRYRRPNYFVLVIGLTALACVSAPIVISEGEAERSGGSSDAATSEEQEDSSSLSLMSDDNSEGSEESECNEASGSCAPVEEVTPEPACGDGRINVAGEACDDANGESGDGCTSSCLLEADFLCPTAGQPCVSTVVCGDAKITGAENCDDGNGALGDGCDASCLLEPGWQCVNLGFRCSASECGDGVKAGSEECDFLASTLGCTQCRIDEGYDCDDSGCGLTVCGNGAVERGEQCEDDNERPYDGCYDCKLEASCSGGSCTSVCGDGQRYDDEQCDDGNSASGDGCSSSCTVEEGFACSDITAAPPPTIDLPVIYRDFIGSGHRLDEPSDCYVNRSDSPTVLKTEPCFHPNFNQLTGTSLQGVVETTLGADGTPDLDCPAGDCSANSGVMSDNFTDNADFDEWYDDDNADSFPVYRTLTLTKTAGASYEFKPAGGFYPIDDAGWTAAGLEWLRPGNNGGAACGAVAHNYSFSSEARFFFEYQGGERFDFRGDDDLWVFVNGQLAIDLAGLHGPRTGYFELDADDDGAGVDTADGMLTYNNAVQNNPVTADFGLVEGGVYEVALFHAERNFCGSNFELTLKDFNKPKSECVSDCGDGILASDELCDDGSAENDGSYGSCGADCLSRGSYCGDGVLDPDDGEVCDDGVNLSLHGEGCAPGCTAPDFCGDGVVQSAFEECDDGVNAGGYAACAANCLAGPRCGDAEIDEDADEECDDGNRVNGDGCNVNCKNEILIVK